MKKKILFISNDLKREASGGRAVSLRNLTLLKSMNEYEIDIVSFSNTELIDKNEFIYKFKSRKYQIMLNNLILFAGSLNFESERKIMKKIKISNYGIVFFDCSLFGRLGKKIKKINENIKIITFFHNVEYLYYKERVKLDGWKYFSLVFSSLYNEKLAIKYSDKIIAINKRDSDVLKEKYNRNGDIELPVSFEDVLDQSKLKIENKTEEIIYLFVGSYFFANIEGITWFVKNVMPKVPGKLQIVGKGMEKLRKELTRNNVEVIGGVEDLAEYYYNVNFIVAPIFSGSGMKVKIAEALMYGKTIFGTTEAFEGYEMEYGKVAEKCNTREEFVKKINLYIREKKTYRYNKFSREEFIKKYSNRAMVKKMNSLIKEL